MAKEVTLGCLPEPDTLGARRRYLRRELRRSRVLLTLVVLRRRRWRSCLRRLHTSLNGDGRLPPALQTLDAFGRHRGSASKQERATRRELEQRLEFFPHAVPRRGGGGRSGARPTREGGRRVRVFVSEGAREEPQPADRAGRHRRTGRALRVRRCGSGPGDVARAEVGGVQDDGMGGEDAAEGAQGDANVLGHFLARPVFDDLALKLGEQLRCAHLAPQQLAGEARVRLGCILGHATEHPTGAVDKGVAREYGRYAPSAVGAEATDVCAALDETHVPQPISRVGIAHTRDGAPAWRSLQRADRLELALEHVRTRPRER